MTDPASDVTLDAVDLTDHDAFVERVPHEWFTLLRREDPVHWQDEPGGRGFWAVTRYDDIREVHRDPARFSSEIGGTSLEDLEPEHIEARKSMIDMDPPRHDELRGMVNRRFTPRAIGAWEEHVRGGHEDGPGRGAAAAGARLRRGDQLRDPHDGLRPDPRRAGGGPPVHHRARRPAARQVRPGVRRPVAGRRAPAPAVLEPLRAGVLRLRPQAGRRAAHGAQGRHRHPARVRAAQPARVRRLLHPARDRGQRDDAPHDLPRPARPARAPRAARAAPPGPLAVPHGRRRDAPLGDAGAPLPAHRVRGPGVRRQGDQAARQGHDLARVRQPRRVRLRGSVHVRHRPHPEQADRLRTRRRAHLPRGASGPHGDPDRVRGDDPAAAQRRARPGRSIACGRTSSTASSACPSASSSTEP